MEVSLTLSLNITAALAGRRAAVAMGRMAWPLGMAVERDL